MKAKCVVLCADDYGYSPGVSRGIRELLEMGRLSATSCIVVFPEFAEDGPLLKPFVGRADLGLHFTLTADRSLRSVAMEMHLRPPPVSVLVSAVEEQVTKFRDAIGCLPDYIDSHQHVHLLPVVREAVVQVASRIGAYVRSSCEPINRAMWSRPAPVESAYLSCASRPLSRFARRSGVATNRGFRGARNFRERTAYRNLFRRMIGGVGEGCLVMCHPGHSDILLGGRDSVQAAREEEWNYLGSQEFLQDIADAELRPLRFRELNLNGTA